MMQTAELLAGTPLKRQQPVEIEKAMDVWARWRFYRASHELGYGECITGKLLDGMPKVRCDASGCQKGATLIVKNGYDFWMPCSSCLGTGWVSPATRGHKVNPKFIHSTGGKYPDPTSPLVDRLVCELKYLAKSVIFQEYTWNGTRQIKQGRIGIGRYAYESILSDAHKFILSGLEK